MSTLYISDLDGTLLLDNETLSEYTCNTINKLVNNGLNFSFATARSRITAKKVTSNLKCPIPMIVYNGTMIVDSSTNKILISNFFENHQVADIKRILESFKIYPIVYSMQNGIEKFSYVPNLVSDGAKTFLDTRKGDVRENPIGEEYLYSGDVFYFTCIDTSNKLQLVHSLLKDSYNCIYQKDYYSKNQWLEILPKDVNKSNAVLQLKRLLNCDRVVCFGDGINDLQMFKISNECYAVENAIPELKSVATGIIESNQNDGVAKWLELNT